ncbi:GDP-mannose 4,6-dehydratase [Sulfuriferula nivalis]|uniref:GDP-mannose 4,6-dehydratase n=1 Tax=Sulfuriferula nivalis TaxID=2675298 RepID=A0A809SGG7_9PROT|nr:GDP-mannose 4,6-dehydratase [Sulfuriferula nivalis]BBO99919.1 GDP-mannose 4,6-dehydratase [Sulfuriferula nivalis]
MPTVLITGITGQDGSYLAELLLTKNCRVIGAVRDVQNAKVLLPEGLQNSVELISWDMLDQHIMVEVLSEYRPAQIYNFAAYSSGAGMFDDPVGVGEVNGLAVTRILEAMREVDTKIRFCQASSREIFGEAVESPQTECTLANPRSPYGAAKLYADSMIRIYRQRYDLFACSAILFNHESPRRGLGFVTRKITHEAAKIKLGLAKELHLGNLDAQRDWGFAGDYVRAMWLMLRQECAEDYIVATGKAHSVRELCDFAFSRLGLDYRDYVREDVSAYRPVEPALLVGCAAKAKLKLKWEPEVGFRELVHMMVDADLRTLSAKIEKN